MALDTLIMFGGASAYCGTASPNFNDTWVLTRANGSGLSAWTNLIPNNAPGSPPIRRGHTAVYDEVHDRMIIYGGDAVNCSSEKLSDVWVLTNATGWWGTPKWEELLVTSPQPPARSDHAAIYDPDNNIMVVAGGTGVFGPVNDTWVLSNANGISGLPVWTQLEPTGERPLVAAQRATVYDRHSNRMTVFGGWNCCTAPLSNEVWVLTHANGLTGSPEWIKLRPTGIPPSPRVGSTAVYDAFANRMILFGGNTSADTTTPLTGQVNQVWVLTHSNGLGGTPVWLPVPISGPQPTPRGGEGDTQNTITYDDCGNTITIFGGFASTTMLNDSWVLNMPR
jgi:hypothetical protein